MKALVELAVERGWGDVRSWSGGEETKEGRVEGVVALVGVLLGPFFVLCASLFIAFLSSEELLTHLSRSELDRILFLCTQNNS